MILKLIPFILPLLIAIIAFKFSVNGTVKLKKSSTELKEPQLIALIKKMSKVLETQNLKIYISKYNRSMASLARWKIYLTAGFLNVLFWKSYCIRAKYGGCSRAGSFGTRSYKKELLILLGKQQ